MDIYTEEQYFDKFYPKSWGSWKDEYNIGMYRKHPRETGVTWEDYHLFGYLTSEDENGIMKVKQYHRPNTIEKFFIKCGDSRQENDICFFIRPSYQPKTGEYFANVELRKKESNLDLYEIRVYDSVGSSYAKQYIRVEDALEDIKLIKELGIDCIHDIGFFFDN